MGGHRDDYKTAKSMSEEEQEIESLSLEAEEIDEDNETLDSYEAMGREYFDETEYE